MSDHNQESFRLAEMLDHGQGQQVGNILRNESYNMSSRDFARIVQETQRFERQGVGDDLVITNNGDVVIQGRYAAMSVANLYRNQGPQNYYDTRPGYGGSNPGHGGYNPGRGDYNPGHGGYNPGRGGYPGRGDYNPGHGGYNPGRGGYNPGYSHNSTETIVSGALGAGLGAVIDHRNPGRGAAIGGTAGVLSSIIGHRNGW